MAHDFAPDMIEELADNLLQAESSSTLIKRLTELLELFGATPAILYLADSQSRVFYPAAAFACERQAADIPFGLIPEAHQFILHSRKEPVGLLTVNPAMAEPASIGRLCAILGPVLMHIHRQESTSRDLRMAREQITHLLTAGDLLRHLEVDVLLVKILETVLTAVRAEVGAVLVPDEKGVLVTRVTWGLRESHLDHILIRATGQRVVDVVHAAGTLLCVSAEEQASVLDLTGLNAQLSGLLALPLTTRDAAKGVVLLGNPAETFGPGQQRLAETVCSLAAIALDNAQLIKAMVDGERMKQEMDLAKSVQASMFPLGNLSPGCTLIEGCSRPCSETGGDYYTYLDRDGRLVTMIGDVSGHGLGAALFTTMAHVLLQQQFRAGTPPEPCFRLLNEGLYHTQSGRFMTAALVEMDPLDGSFSYVSAGHTPLLWLHQGEPKWLESCGMPLGIMDFGDWPVSEVYHPSAGDYLILYTDGFTEGTNAAGEPYDESRLGAIVQQGAKLNLDPSSLMVLINADIDEWTRGHAHDDDLTIIVIKIKGPGEIVTASNQP
jgi:sigma-B regulation protein RsbU (phosphoserine phosphatase)